MFSLKKFVRYPNGLLSIHYFESNFFNIIGYQSLPVVCLRLPSRKQIIGSGKVQEGAA